MGLLKNYIMLKGHSLDLSIVYMGYLGFHKDIVNLNMLDQKGYRYELENDYCHILLKLFQDHGCDQLMGSLKLSQCLNMSPQNDLAIRRVLELDREIPNINRCQFMVSFKGKRYLCSMNNNIEKSCSNHFTRDIFTKYLGLETQQYEPFGLYDYALARDIDIILSLETTMDSPSISYHQLNLFQIPLFPNLSIFKSPIDSSLCFG